MTAATTEPSGSRPPVRLAAGGIEVSFEWAGDRWRHRVTLGGRPLVESVEGAGPDGDPRWPASPALQEVAAADAGGRRAILAVGSAGRSHFSASVVADPECPDTLLVEVACRIVESAEWLGSTYRDAAGRAALIPAAGRAALIPAAARAARISVAGGDAVPRTVCWSYRIGPGGVTPAAAAG